MNMLKNVVASLLLIAATGAAWATERVNINAADAATLDRVLVGVGPAKAEAIVAHRRAHGAFRSIDQLVDVQGIGLATLEKNRDRMVLGAAPARPVARAAAAPAPRAPAQR